MHVVRTKLLRNLEHTGYSLSGNNCECYHRFCEPQAPALRVGLLSGSLQTQHGAAEALPPYILADLLDDSLLDEQVISE